MKLLIFFVFLLCSCLCQDTIYVSMTGVDSPECGVIQQPCATIAYGVNKGMGGGNILLLPGTHRITATIPLQSVFSLSSTQTTQSTNVDPTVVDLANNANSKKNIILKEKSLLLFPPF